MNCLHKVVVFHPLKPEELDEVLEIELGNVQKLMLDSTMRPFLFRITEEGRKFPDPVAEIPPHGVEHFGISVALMV